MILTGAGARAMNRAHAYRVKKNWMLCGHRFRGTVLVIIAYANSMFLRREYSKMISIIFKFATSVFVCSIIKNRHHVHHNSFLNTVSVVEAGRAHRISNFKLSTTTIRCNTRDATCTPTLVIRRLTPATRIKK